MMKYFDKKRNHYDNGPIQISRNNEDVGKEYTDEEEVYIQVSAGARGYAYTAVSRQDARLIAKALNDIADEWDEADRRYAEEHKPNVEKILKGYPIGTQFRFSWTLQESYYVKVSETESVYHSGLTHQTDYPRPLSDYFHDGQLPEMI